MKQKTKSKLAPYTRGQKTSKTVRERSPNIRRVVEDLSSGMTDPIVNDDPPVRMTTAQVQSMPASASNVPHTAEAIDNELSILPPESSRGHLKHLSKEYLILARLAEQQDWHEQYGRAAWVSLRIHCEQLLETSEAKEPIRASHQDLVLFGKGTWLGTDDEQACLLELVVANGFARLADGYIIWYRKQADFGYLCYYLKEDGSGPGLLHEGANYAEMIRCIRFEEKRMQVHVTGTQFGATYRNVRNPKEASRPSRSIVALCSKYNEMLANKNEQDRTTISA